MNRSERRIPARISRQLSTPETKTALPKPWINAPRSVAKSTVQTTLPQPSISRWQTLVVVPEIPGQPTPSPLGEPGEYVLTVTLRPPALSTFGMHWRSDKDGMMGDSLLSLPSEVMIVEASPEGQQRINLLPNAEGRLGCMRVRLHAQHWAEAEQRGVDHCQHFLSALAVMNHIALDIVAVTTWEKASGLVATTGGMIGEVKPLDVSWLSEARPLPGHIDPAFTNLFSAYREALATENSFHQVICFWRVYEGLRVVRDQLREELKDVGGTLLDHKLPEHLEHIPAGYQDGVNNTFWPRILGKTHQQAIEEFQGEYRDALAHLGLGTKPRSGGAKSPILIADHFAEVIACGHLSTLLEYILRDFLRQTLAAHPRYRDFPLH